MQLIDNIYEFDSVNSLEENLIKNDNILNEYVFNKIESSIKNNDNELLLFKVFDKQNDEKLSITIKRCDLIGPLKKCIEKFKINEEYEKCSKCLNLIKKLNDEKKV